MRHLIKTISSSTNQPVGYLFIKHLASIVEKKTEGVGLNSSAKKLLTREDWEELNFPNVRTFVCYVKLAPREIYNSVIKFWKHLVLVDKQNQKLKSKFTNYKKANKAYIINNTQLKAENDNLENQLADLEKLLKIARSDRHLTLSSPLPPPSTLVVSDDLDNNSK